MNSAQEQYVERGRRMLLQALERLKSVDDFIAKKEANLAVREAQEALEQAVKAGVLLTGNNHVKGHEAEAIEQLKNILEKVLLSSSRRPEIASRVQGINNYYALLYAGSSLKIMKKVGGTYTLLGNCTLPAPNTIIDLEVDGSTLIAKANTQILLQLTDTSLSYGFRDRWYFPVKVTMPFWDALLTAARTLAKLREPAFYEETQYSESDAVEARRHLLSALDLLREAFGVLS